MSLILNTAVSLMRLALRWLVTVEEPKFHGRLKQDCINQQMFRVRRD